MRFDPFWQLSTGLGKNFLHRLFGGEDHDALFVALSDRRVRSPFDLHEAWILSGPKRSWGPG
jgi:hypothetical protein